MTGCRRAAPSLVAPHCCPSGPPRNCRIPTSQPAHRHQPSLYLLSLATSTNKPRQKRLICQPRCLVSPCCPTQKLPPPTPRAILDREDGEGRGAKDTTGVHPRRLRRPHLGPRCRSRYAMSFGSLPLTPPSSTGLLRARIHRCWKPRPASPAATPSVEALSSNSFKRASILLTHHPHPKPQHIYTQESTRLTPRKQ